MTISHSVSTPGSAPAATAAGVSPSRSGLRRSLRVLLVKDERPDARLIAAPLEQSRFFGCSVTHAPDMETARAALAAGTFDLTILDYWMGAERSLTLLDHPACLRDGGPALLLSAIDVVDVRGAARRGDDGRRAGLSAQEQSFDKDAGRGDTRSPGAANLTRRRARRLVGPAGLEPATRPL